MLSMNREDTFTDDGNLGIAALFLLPHLQIFSRAGYFFRGEQMRELIRRVF